jgi:antitoxin component YwqK of YwqJK toxin-antitoxin module
MKLSPLPILCALYVLCPCFTQAVESDEDRPFLELGSMPLSPLQQKHSPDIAYQVRIEADGSRTETPYQGSLRQGKRSRFAAEGQLIETVYYQQDQRHGPCTRYFSNGKLREEGLYEKGLKTGLWRRWHANGQLAEESHWYTGERFGSYQQWRPNGACATKGEYFADLPDGEWRWYNHYEQVLKRSVFDRGTGSFCTFAPKESLLDPDEDPWYICKEEELQDGQRHGVQRSYYPDGGLCISSHYSQGVQSGRYEEFWERNQQGEQQVKRLGAYQNGLAHGEWKEWHPGGLLKRSLRYRAGAPQGQEVSYHDDRDGQICVDQIGKYRRGERYGKWESYYPDGTLKRSEQLAHGLCNGPCISYHPNGEIASEEPYSNDLREGLCRYYDQEGALKSEVEYSKDQIHGSYREYYPDGQVAVEGSYDSALADGTWTWYTQDEHREIVQSEFSHGSGTLYHFYPDGVKKAELTLVHGVKHGKETWWHDTGYIQRAAEYTYGLLDGPLTDYDADGFVAQQIHWRQGQRHGPYRRHYANRKLAVEMCFCDDLPDGEVKEWYESGELKCSGTWQNGRRLGRWTWYDHRGDIVEENSFTPKQRPRIQ